MGDKRWYTVTEACKILGVSRSTLDKWRAKGSAPRMVRLPNGSLRVEAEELDAWMAALPVAA